MAWASTPPCSPRPGYFSVLASRKARTSCPTFLGQTDEKPRFSSVRWCSLAASCRRVAVLRLLLHGKLGHRVRLSLGRPMKSRGFHRSAGAHWRHPVDGWSEAARSARPVASAPGFLSLLHAGRNRTPNERGGARAHERAPKASAARRAEAQRTGSERRPGWPT